MKRFWAAIAAVAALSACSGGNPFGAGTDTDVDPTVIPELVAGDLDGITYDANSQTLTIRGISLDDQPYEAVYRRRPGMDRGGYEAYTSQDGSLDRHTTAYVREVAGTRAAIVMAGGQFEHVFYGGVYGRDGAYDPPTQGNQDAIVNYAGNYIGMLNGPGDGGDLLPVAGGTPADIRPFEAGEITGRILVNADFIDNTVNGTVYDRVYVDNGNMAIANINLSPTAIDPATGQFDGDVDLGTNPVGKYGGIFGGPDAEAVAGALYAENHIEQLQNEIETGLFVLNKCGTSGEDALCNQPTR